MVILLNGPEPVPCASRAQRQMVLYVLELRSPICAPWGERGGTWAMARLRSRAALSWALRRRPPRLARGRLSQFSERS
eukprot:776063-Pyramimonas_sp.AAC.1